MKSKNLHEIKIVSVNETDISQLRKLDKYVFRHEEEKSEGKSFAEVKNIKYKVNRKSKYENNKKW